MASSVQEKCHCNTLNLSSDPHPNTSSSLEAWQVNDSIVFLNTALNTNMSYVNYNFVLVFFSDLTVSVISLPEKPQMSIILFGSSKKKKVNCARSLMV